MFLRARVLAASIVGSAEVGLRLLKVSSLGCCEQTTLEDIDPHLRVLRGDAEDSFHVEGILKGSCGTMSFMKSRNRGAVTIVMILVGMLVGLAPLLHAICIAPPAGAVGSSISHVMADGIVMAVTAQTTAAETPAAGAAETLPMIAALGTAVAEVVDLAPTTGLGVMLGAIVLVAGLAMLTILGVRFCRSRAVLVASIAWVVPRSILPEPALARPPTDISLLALGISRT